mmetsp:Transcript_115598/g.327614  ORF Transcript_115598/g.327614 Transcript_115598/m.327614 type:complete len:244 (+) Transcript_115598:1481-2212(+)
MFLMIEPRPLRSSAKRCSDWSDLEFPARAQNSRPQPIAKSFPVCSFRSQAGKGSPALTRFHKCFAAMNSCIARWWNRMPSAVDSRRISCSPCPSRISASMASVEPRFRVGIARALRLSSSKASSPTAASTPISCSLRNSAVSWLLAASSPWRQCSKTSWWTSPQLISLGPEAARARRTKLAIRGLLTSSRYCGCRSCSLILQNLAGSRSSKSLSHSASKSPSPNGLMRSFVKAQRSTSSSTLW